MFGDDRKERVQEQLADVDARLRNLRGMVDAGASGLAILAAIQASVRALERSAHCVVEGHFAEESADTSPEVLRDELAWTLQFLVKAQADRSRPRFGRRLIEAG